MFEKNLIKEKLFNHQSVIGTWNLIEDGTVIEILGKSGFDFVIIDMEHGPHSFNKSIELIRAAENVNLTPLIRPQGVDESSILRALDCGAHGLMVPNISSLLQIKNLIELTFYPPIGKRGHSPFTRAGIFTHNESGKRMEFLNQNIFLGILIEGSEGINALNDILKNYSNYIDLIYIGVYDLAKSIGCMGDIKNKKVLDSIKDISKKCNENNINVGVLCNDEEMIDFSKRLDIKFICYQNDTGIISEAAKKITKLFK